MIILKSMAITSMINAHGDKNKFTFQEHPTVHTFPF